MKCIIWPGAKDKDGYGFVKINGKQFRSHRIALEIKIGRKLKDGEIAMHECDNPSCIEQSHLSVGTVKKNNEQARLKQETFVKKYLKGWEKLYG